MQRLALPRLFRRPHPATLASVDSSRHGLAHAVTSALAERRADVLRHRVALSYEALSEGLDADALIQRIMAKNPAPARPLHHEPKAA